MNTNTNTETIEAQGDRVRALRQTYWDAVLVVYNGSPSMDDRLDAISAQRDYQAAEGEMTARLLAMAQNSPTPEFLTFFFAYSGEVRDFEEERDLLFEKMHDSLQAQQQFGAMVKEMWEGPDA